MGLYVVLMEKWTESEPADDLIHISGRLIATIPPILLNADGPMFERYLCNYFRCPAEDSTTRRLEKCPCCQWKATASDHNVFFAVHLLSSDVLLSFGGTDHHYIFSAMPNLGPLLTLVSHLGSSDCTKMSIRPTNHLDKPEMPDYMLAYELIMMLKSIGAKSNNMTA